VSLQNRKQELMGQIDRVMTACSITPDQVVGFLNCIETIEKQAVTNVILLNACFV